MRKFSIVYGLIFILAGSLFAQVKSKPVIDTSLLGNWPGLANYGISPDGQFSYYLINDQLHVVSNTGKWKTVTARCSGTVVAAANSKFLVFSKGQDSVGICRPGLSQITYLPGGSNFKLAGLNNSPLLIGKATDNELVIYDPKKNSQQRFGHVSAYYCCENNKAVLIQSEGKLSRLDLSTGKSAAIYEGPAVEKLTMDRSGSQFLYCVKKQDSLSFYYYGQGMSKAQKTVVIKLPGIDPDIDFNRSGTKALLSYHKMVNKSLDTGEKRLIVWNTQNDLIPGQNSVKQYLFEIDVKADRLVCLDDGDEILTRIQNSQDYVLTRSPALEDAYNNRNHRSDFYLVSTSTGKRELIAEKISTGRMEISPNEKYVVWFDPDSLAWFSYDIAAKMKRSISDGISELLYDKKVALWGRSNACSYEMAGWSPEGRFVYLYDQFDIWKVDLSGKNPPLNYTKGFGRKHRIVLSFEELEPVAGKDILANKGDLILSGYSRETKMNGFFHLKPEADTDPEGAMENCCYHIKRTGLVSGEGHVASASGIEPIRAARAKVYLVSKETAKDFPNLYVTTDFKHYKKISDLHPERAVNWLTAELINWKQLDGTFSQGILYKPENFESTKKYPLIFDYYEKRSDELHQYIIPRFIRDRINISYLVSNGYLVFVPDIYYPPGYSGDGVVNSVVSAAEFLKHFSWVDSTRLGLQGHSFGGWETNYLITHSNLFAAGCSVSGVGDQISETLSLYMGRENYYFYEVGAQSVPYGLGITPWKSPETYIRNSPIFFVSNVSTPLLLVHGDKDQVVPFAQSLEMFLALRRAGKKAWLLEYANGTHGFYEDEKDLTIRMKQFFDYYLKAGPMPAWMQDNKLKSNSNGAERTFNNRILEK